MIGWHNNYFVFWVVASIIYSPTVCIELAVISWLHRTKLQAIKEALIASSFKGMFFNGFSPKKVSLLFSNF